MQDREILRGDIYYVDFGFRHGCEQSGMRPVLIIQNDVGNHYSKTVIVAPLSSRIKKMYLPTHVLVYPGCSGLQYRSVVMLEQITTVDKNQLQAYVGRLHPSVMRTVDRAICESTGVIPCGNKSKMKSNA